MPMNIRIRKKQTKIFLPIIAAVLLVGAFLFLFFTHTWPFSQSQSDTAETRPTNSVDYSAPTDNEIKDSQNAKKQNYADSDNQNANGATKNVTVGTTYADVNSNNQLEIRAFIGGVVEGNGTCTATVSKGATTVTASNPAFIDVSTSICEPIYIDKTRFTAGTWSVTVSYSSPDAKGSSEPIEVTIQ